MPKVDLEKLFQHKLIKAGQAYSIYQTGTVLIDKGNSVCYGRTRRGTSIANDPQSLIQSTIDEKVENT